VLELAQRLLQPPKQPGIERLAPVLLEFELAVAVVAMDADHPIHLLQQGLRLQARERHLDEIASHQPLQPVPRGGERSVAVPEGRALLETCGRLQGLAKLIAVLQIDAAHRSLSR
jgi:arginase family enzyme